MTDYQAALYPWKVIRSTPKQGVIIVAHCRTESDAQGHLQVFQRTVSGDYQIQYHGGLVSAF